MAINLQALTAPVWVETAGLGQRFDFGCVPLGPGDFDSHAATLFGLVAGIDIRAGGAGAAPCASEGQASLLVELEAACRIGTAPPLRGGTFDGVAVGTITLE